MNSAEKEIGTNKNKCVMENQYQKIIPGCAYVVEDEENFIGSCLYNIDSPVMVMTYKSRERLLNDATRSEIEAHLPEAERENTVVTDMMIAEKRRELDGKAIKIKPNVYELIGWDFLGRIFNKGADNANVYELDDRDFLDFRAQTKGPIIVLIDGFQSRVVFYG